ncbi:MAG: M43 family zinc metalloprotease, partial [Chitinophagales bacterium]
MKKILLMMAGAFVFWAPQMSAQTQRPEKCGMHALHDAMIAQDPSWAQKFEDQKASLQAAADYYLQLKASGTLEKTTTISAVPVIFHIIVDSAQFNNLGGTAGIIKRCDSQIVVLNRDFNKHNADSTLIPSGWKSLYGNPGISFGLARKDPSGNCSPGYEVKIISGNTLTDAGFDSVCWAFPDAKRAGTGLPSWDYTKYYNVWCINFTNGSGSCFQGVGLLGLTVPLSQGTATNQVGVCILYNTLGTTGPTGSDPGTGAWSAPYNLGRTLTHETGHFFEIWHPWGDDGGLCPWNGGSDDGLSDTPPEGDAVYGNPVYTITGGTYNDGCKMNGATNTQPIGIACLSYMDYTDDNAMHMFTKMQAAAMASMVLVPATGGAGATGYGTIGESYSLT